MRKQAMTYDGPMSQTIVDPTPEDLRKIIFDEPASYWYGGSGASDLSVVEHRGPKHIAILENEPAIMFFLVESHGFFFNYFDNTEKITRQFVPLAEGGASRPWVEHGIGGDSFYAPLACFVARDVAWEIVTEFLRTKARSAVVSWVKRSTLEFPNPGAGDSIPYMKELA
jgi:hypothetical protein